MSKSNQPQHFIFLASDSDKNRMSKPSADALARYRLTRREWGLGANTKNRRTLSPGDRVVVYLSGHRENGRHFIAECKIASDVFPVPPSLARKIDAPDGLGNSPASFSVELNSVKYFRKPVPIEPLKGKLSFVKQPESKKWGAFLQGGIVKISASDFQMIAGYRA